MSAAVGLIIVDHGSSRSESNRLLEEVARQFEDRYGEGFGAVEAAHMEMAEPSIGTAYGRLVARGAERVVVCPFFLGPGKHMTTDIPRLAHEAAGRHPGTEVVVAGPLGVDELILDLIAKRAREAL